MKKFEFKRYLFTEVHILKDEVTHYKDFNTYLEAYKYFKDYDKKDCMLYSLYDIIMGNVIAKI